MMLFSKNILTLLLIYFSTHALSDDLGRLFTSSEERIKLESLRHYENQNPTSPKQLLEESANGTITNNKKTINKPISLEGIVYRNNRKSTIWINNNKLYEDELNAQDIKILNNKIEKDRVKVILSDPKRVIELKVGDSYIPDDDNLSVINK